jgi:hypothetical protein
MESYAATGLPPDFRVSYRLYSPEEGGRQTPPHQHIRWDFTYDDKSISRTGGFMIWPEMLLPSGGLAPAGPIPAQGLADMFIIYPQYRAFHRLHLRPGVRGYFMEGNRRVGVCEVVEVLGLHTNPA